MWEGARKTSFRSSGRTAADQAQDHIYFDHDHLFEADNHHSGSADDYQDGHREQHDIRSYDDQVKQANDRDNHRAQHHQDYR